MIPVYQQYMHDPENNVLGDCHRAAFASILNLPIEKVPHFVRDTWDQAEGRCEGFELAVDAFLNDLGMAQFHYYLTARSKAEVREVIDIVGKANPDCYWILGSTAERGYPHSVVCLGGEIVHDPYPSEVPVHGRDYAPLEGDCIMVTVIVPGFLDRDQDYQGAQYRREAIASGQAAVDEAKAIAGAAAT